MTKLKPYWVSWYGHRYGSWELHSPWWVSGERCSDDALTICAAVMAKDEMHAQNIIIAAHDDAENLGDLEWRFVEEKEPGWSPFCDRFQRRDWMQWPDAEQAAT